MSGIEAVGLGPLLGTLQSFGLGGLRQVRLDSGSFELFDDVAPAGCSLHRNGSLLAREVLSEFSEPLSEALPVGGADLAAVYLAGVHLDVVEGDLLPMHVETTYSMSIWRGLLKLRLRHNTGMVSHRPRLRWGGLPSRSFSLLWPFHVIFFEGRPPLLFPALDGLLVPLVSPALRFLQALPQSLEQSTHVSRMVAYPKLSSDHYSHSLARPYIPSKAVSLGSPLQKLGQFRPLLLAQARRCSRGGLAL